MNLHFEVQDTGIGIPEDKQSLIFDSFSQADGSVTRRYGGTGLGLSISRSLVKLMDGHMWLESAEGVGSRFHFTARFVSTTSPRRFETAFLRNRRVLVLDTCPPRIESLVKTLQSWGAIPLAVDNLPLLLGLLDSGSPVSAIIVAGRLPAKLDLQDEPGLRRVLLSHPALTGSARIHLCPFSENPDAFASPDLQGFRRLAMPFGPRELLDALQHEFSGEGSATSLPSSVVNSYLLPPADKNIHILVAEDNRINQLVVKRILELRGYQVVIANHGLEALALLGKHTFDVFLCDLQMPELDGFGTTAEIRRRETITGQRLPIIALTAHAMQGDAQRCLEAGMDGHVTKPLDQLKLFQAIESVLRAQPVTAR